MSESGECRVDAHDVDQMTILFTRLANAAKADPRVAAQVREALATSELLGVFGAAGTVDVVDLLDAGGEVTLRARLAECSLTELKQIVSANSYDPEKETIRWRSSNKFIDLIVRCAQRQFEEELVKQPANAAAWML
jgi:hypothetical protein